MYSDDQKIVKDRSLIILKIVNEVIEKDTVKNETYKSPRQQSTYM